MKWVLLLLPLCVWADWADERLAEMTMEEKIGQLFVAPACPLRGEDHWADWQKLMRDCFVGNAIVKQSDPIHQILFLNHLQKASQLPMLVMADAEWGLAMRMSDTIAFPKNMTLGAVEDMGLIYRLGREIGRQARLVGVHMNLAPVADVNSNPSNSVIGMRSFGEDPVRVGERLSAFVRGMQSAGTLACVKHFPGHGDTSIDSHWDLPVIKHSRERLRQVELVPFKKAVEDGVYALMTAHLYVPALDEVHPTSLSESCGELLREDLHFNRLIVSDALNMKAIANRYSPEEVALLARKAGCDLLLYGDHIEPNVNEIVRSMIPRAFMALKKAYAEGELEVGDLDASVLKILRSKEHVERVLVTKNVMQALHTDEARELKRELFEKAVTLVGENVFPIEEASYWSVGEGDVLAGEFGEGERVVVAIHQKEALTDEVMERIDALGDRAIVCLFTTPYLLERFGKQKTVVVGYENDSDAQQAVLGVLKGVRRAEGHLPVTVSGR